MRFMMLVSSAPDRAPNPEAMARLLDYKKSLHKAGVLLAQDALFPSSSAARISYKDGKATVTDAPIAQPNESIVGYWIIQARSREEAIEWARRAPMSNNDAIEIRQIHNLPDGGVL